MKLVLSIILFFVVASTSAQDSIRWYQISDVDSLVKVSSKPVLVKIEAPWCGYCKMMDQKVFSNKKFIKRFKNDFYFVRLNAESREPIVFNGKTYNYTMYSIRSGVHQLAKFLGEENGRLSYPTVVILNNTLEVIKKEVGYMDRLNFMMWLDSEE